MKISIVLPAKNEAGAIGDTIDKIHALNIAKEILVVNDGSTDQTQEVAEKLGARELRKRSENPIIPTRTLSLAPIIRL